MNEKLHHTIHLIRRGLYHLLRGTWPERLRARWQPYVLRQRRVWWESQIGQRSEFQFCLRPGVRMWLHLDSQLARLIYCEDFEWQEQRFILKFLRQGDVFVDIGANIGLFSLIAARRVGKSGHVYTFEPSSRTFRRLQANIELNRLNNVSCYQLALSDSVAQLNLNVSLDGYDAWNSMAQPFEGNSFTVEKVNAVTWNEFASPHGLVGRVVMMKIDVEGWESRVLLGGREWLSREDAPVLQVEFTEQAAESAGSSCSQLYCLLEELGYRMFVYNVDTNTVVPDPLRTSYPYLNLIAAKHPEAIIARLTSRSNFWRWL